MLTIAAGLCFESGPFIGNEVFAKVNINAWNYC